MAQDETDEREEYESGGEHSQVKAPMQRTLQHRFARQARAMQEEQKRDREERDEMHDFPCPSRRREQAGDDDRRGDGEREIVGPVSA